MMSTEYARAEGFVYTKEEALLSLSLSVSLLDSPTETRGKKHTDLALFLGLVWIPPLLDTRSPLPLSFC